MAAQCAANRPQLIPRRGVAMTISYFRSAKVTKTAEKPTMARRIRGPARRMAAMSALALERKAPFEPNGKNDEFSYEEGGQA
jgi:hypothetical protein